MRRRSSAPFAGQGTPRAEAQAALDRIGQLVALAGADDRLHRRIGDLVAERTPYGTGELPNVEEVRRKLGEGLDPASPALTVGEWLDTWLPRSVTCGPRRRATTAPRSSCTSSRT